jgi:hypothetical protein
MINILENGVQAFEYLKKKKKKAEERFQTFGYNVANRRSRRPTQMQIDEYGREWRDRGSGKQI